MRISKKAILEGLRTLYPDAAPELHFRNPYETLVAVMLSAQCTDKQVNKVTPALFERYPTVRDMAAASVEDVYPMVKSCGFKTKAANIVSACRLIMQKPRRRGARHHGGAHRAARRGAQDRQRRAGQRLRRAHHRGGYACIPRVQPAGLADAKTVEETERQLQKAIPKKDWVAAHHWLIFHGRRVCHARGPSAAPARSGRCARRRGPRAAR